MNAQNASPDNAIGVLERPSDRPVRLTAESEQLVAKPTKQERDVNKPAKALKAEATIASAPAQRLAEQLRAHEAHRAELLERVRGGGRLSNQDSAWAHRRRGLLDQLRELEAAQAAPGCAAALAAQDSELLDALERASADCERAWADGQAQADWLEQEQLRRRLTGAEWDTLEARWALSDRRYCLRAIRRALTMETAAQVRLEQARRA